MGLLKHISRIFKPQKKWLYRIENGIAYDRNGNVVEELSRKDTPIVFDGLLYENGDFVGETIISISFGGEVHTTRHATNENWFETSKHHENPDSCEREPNSDEVKVPLEGLVEKYGTAITDDIFKQIQDCRKKGYNNVILKQSTFNELQSSSKQISDRWDSWDLARTHYLNGKYLEKSENVDAAIEAYEEALKYEPTAHNMYKRLLVLYRRRKEFENEKRVIKLAIKVFSNEREMRLDRAIKEIPELKDKLVDIFENGGMISAKEGGLYGHGYHYSFPRDTITPYEERLKKIETKMQKQ